MEESRWQKADGFVGKGEKNQEINNRDAVRGKKRGVDKVRQEHRRQLELSIYHPTPQCSAQPAGYQTGEFQPMMWEQRDMMTSLHKTLQSLLKRTHSHTHSAPPCSAFTEAHSRRAATLT